MSNNKSILNSEQIARCIRLAIKASKLGGYTPPCIVGPPGCGKTDTINAVGRALSEATKGKFRTQITILSYMDHTDFGVPFKNEAGQVEYALPTWMPTGDDYVLWYLDEFDRAPVEVQNAALQLLLGGHIHGRSIGKNVFVVLSMNATTDSYTIPLSRAAANRLTFLYTGNAAPGQVDSWAEWASDNNVHPASRAFPKFAVEELEDKGLSDIEELAFCSLRSLSAADRIYQAAQLVDIPTADILPAMIAGTIGGASSVKFLAYHDLYGKAPSIEEIENDPKGSRIPDEAHIKYALTLALCDREVKRLDPVVEYMLRIPNKELIVVGFKKLIERNSEAMNIPALRKWCGANASILMG